MRRPNDDLLGEVKALEARIGARRCSSPTLGCRSLRRNRRARLARELKGEQMKDIGKSIHVHG